MGKSRTVKKRARMDKAKPMVDLIAAKKRTDKMVHDILNSPQLKELHRILDPARRTFAQGWDGGKDTMELTVHIWGKSEYKKDPFHYIKDHVNLPDNIKYYLSVIAYCINAEFTLCDNWPAYVMYFYEKYHGSDLIEFVKFARDEGGVLTKTSESTHLAGKNILGSGDIGDYLKLGELERENYLHIFLSHFMFMGDVPFELASFKKQGKKKRKKQRKKQRNKQRKRKSSKRTTKKRAGMEKLMLMFDLMDGDVKEQLSEIVKTKRYANQLKKARVYTEKMIADILNDPQLDKLLKIFSETTFQHAYEGTNATTDLTVHIWGKPEYKKTPVEYIREYINLPATIIYYLSFCVACADFNLNDIVNWPECFALFMHGVPEEPAYLLREFMMYFRDEDECLTQWVAKGIVVPERELVGSGDIHDFLKLSELERENYLHIFLSHFIFKDDDRASLKKKKSRRKRRNTR